ncbi:MAG: PQQ-like beta-propeller repeat protein [Gemmataceae bacterium]|nr:PQQ-like beta-propeller repeat protein [Gemmataceae bacterium]MCI0738620.1 PQQ-like beta-propeller repeat protein [Gemmataceae bacterium]
MHRLSVTAPGGMHATHVIVAALLVLAVYAVPARGDDWPQFLGPNRDGASLEKGLAATWGAKGPPVLWQKDVGEGFSGPIVAGVFVGERMIVFHRVGGKEVVECWKSQSGERIWQFDYPCAYVDDFGKGNGPRATPTVAGQRVITLGADGMLHCLHLDKGTKHWSRNLAEEYKTPPSFFGVGSSPVVDDGLVLVNVGGRDAGIVAFSVADGKEVWNATKHAASYSSPVVRTIDGTKHAIFLTREGVVILDPAKGTIRHQQRFRARIDASVNAATPLLIGDLGFFSASYDTGALLLKVRKNGADEVWQGDGVMSNHYNTCVFHDGHLYGFDGRQEVGPDFRCVNLKTKDIAWDKKRFGCGSIILADGKLIVLMESGELLLVDATPKAYRELARAQVFDAAPCRAHPALANGRLYARDQKKLVCLDLKAR